VELEYSELLVPDDATYEFVYPTVVGPRYGGGADPGRDRWISNPYLTEGKPEPYKFDLRAHVETGIALKELASPSHEVKISYAGPNRADVTLAGPGGGNRDFVLRYRLAGDKVETGALVWEGPGAGGSGREGFFAVMMEPPRRPSAAQIPPREYIFLVDVSGSMNGFPLNTAKELMRNLLGRLRPSDRFDVVLFAGASSALDPAGSVPATPANIARAVAFVGKEQGGGGTELMGGLSASYGIPGRTLGVARTVVVITDGYVGVEASAFRFIRERLNDANLFAFGIGSSVNRGLIEGMARAGLGEPFVVMHPQQAAAAADRLRAYIEQPVLTDIHVDFQNLSAVEVAPGRIPDLMARRPLVIYGKLRGPASGRIVVSGMTGQGRFEQALAVRPADVRAENAPLRWLWARKWVETLEDERHMGAGKPVEEAITSLGLGYNLLTAFTSFVAVDSQVVNRGGAGETVKQPLPLPEGVSNLAVGDGMATMGMGATGGMPHHMAKAKRPAAAELSPAPATPRQTEAEEAAPPRAAKAARSPRAATAPRPSAPDADERRAPRLTLGSVVGVADARPLLQKLQALQKTIAGCLGGAAGGEVVLKLSVDAGGRVVKVDLVRGDTRLLRCLRDHLVGLVTATRAGGAAPGVVEVVMTL
jgi:Ca-activated chloride channel family protein